MGKILTIKDVMVTYQISRPTVKRWMDKGLKYFKVGRGIRIEEDDLKDYLEKQNQRES
jgi:excisionase family DNA binding protein